MQIGTNGLAGLSKRAAIVDRSKPGLVPCRSQSMSKRGKLKDFARLGSPNRDKMPPLESDSRKKLFQRALERYQAKSTVAAVLLVEAVGRGREARKWSQSRALVTSDRSDEL